MNSKSGFWGLLLCAAAAFSADDYSQWRYYRPVTLNTTAIGANVSATQWNFPTLVRLNSTNFDFSKSSRTGADVRFAKTNGAHLPYQIEQWDSAGRSAAVWVLLDTVPGNSNRIFWMYYGKTGSTDSSKATKVFDTANGFQGVFHLAEATNDTARDATVNGFKGVPHNFGGLNPKDTLGVIGHSKNFLGHDTSYHPVSIQDSGGNYRILNSTGSNTFTNNPLNFQNDSATRNGLPLYTLSAWINVRVFPLTSYHYRKGIIAKSRGISGSQYHMGLPNHTADGVFGWDTNLVTFKDGPSATYKGSPYWTYTDLHSDLPPNTWVYLTAVRSGWVGMTTSLRMCLNAKCVMGDTSTITTTRSDYDVTIGSFSNDSAFFPGLLDEVRLENVARDSLWIRLNYATQRADSSAVTVGGETMVGIQAWHGAHFSDKPFSFHLPAGVESARIQIVSIGGQVVWSRTLRKNDGLEELSWNGTAGNGRPASPGIYVVRMLMLNADHKSMGMIERRIAYLP